MPYVPSQEETKEFISTISDLKVKTMVALMYSSGLRQSEVRMLRYEDIHRKKMRVHIAKSKNRSDRYAILSSSALDLLTKYWSEYDRPTGWLFPKQRDKSRPIDGNYLSRHIHEHERELGWPERITCHSFRHAFGTHLYENGADQKYLGATPGIIQFLHTWNQELLYHVHVHVHMHCIISGGGITPDHKLKRSKASFFIPVHVLRDKFKGKYLAKLQQLYQDKKLYFSDRCKNLTNPRIWDEFLDSLYAKDWCPYIKETFNGFGNAIEYLGRYTHKIAISNSRIISVSETHTSFSARAKRPGEPRHIITVSNEEFIRRFLMHVLPPGFQKIRYYGFLNNRMKSANLKLIFTLQGQIDPTESFF